MLAAWTSGETEALPSQARRLKIADPDNGMIETAGKVAHRLAQRRGDVAAVYCRHGGGGFFRTGEIDESLGDIFGTHFTTE